MHMLKGNTVLCRSVELKGGESVWEVQGTRSSYRVFLSSSDSNNACSCRVFLNEGTCGHIDAAVSTAKQQGILGTKVRFSPSATDRGLAALGSPSTQVRPTASGASCLPSDTARLYLEDLRHLSNLAKT